MNIKSLLLGSAAAMVAVSGAQAADAVVVEPEPVEYVRVCDAYGSGFFFIPGTETCLRISGYVRSTYSHIETADNELDANPTTTTTDPDDDDLRDTADRWRTRARIEIDARNETDWGTLRSYVRLQANYFPSEIANNATLNGQVDDNSANGDFNVSQVYITLGGFRIGRTLHYWTANHGSGWVNASSASLIDDAGWYGSAGTDVLFDYTWSGDGLAITAGISSDSGYSGSIADVDIIDIYAGANYSGDGWGAAFTYVADGRPSLSDADSWRASVNFDLSEFIPGGTIQFQYMDSDVAGGAGYLDSDFFDQWHVGFQMSPTDNTEFFATYSEGDDNDNDGDSETFTVGINWYPVDGLKILASYSDRTNDNIDSEAFLVGVRRSF